MRVAAAGITKVAGSRTAAKTVLSVFWVGTLVGRGMGGAAR